MKTFVIALSPKVTVDKAWKRLSSFGAEFLFSEEESGIRKIYLKCDKDILDHSDIAQITPYTIPDIDWNAQWEGKNELSLDSFGFPNKTILMSPGSGFGDLSHPTTTLVCQLMSGKVKGKKVLDIGSGSGILSFAALEMGAKEVVGVEIDPEAIEHAKKNAALNGMDIHFYLPGHLKNYRPDIALMNMIYTEQQVAWESLSLKNPCLIITSGILAEHKSKYLLWATSMGWKLQEIAQDGNWLGFVFHSSKSL